jgi:hypothetical protein
MTGMSLGLLNPTTLLRIADKSGNSAIYVGSRFFRLQKSGSGAMVRRMARYKP